MGFRECPRMKVTWDCENVRLFGTALIRLLLSLSGTALPLHGPSNICCWQLTPA
jgi:hypothetical protein